MTMATSPTTTSRYWHAAFWRAVAERAIRTFAQSLLAVLSVGGLDLMSVPWQGALSSAGFATLLSVLTSVAANKFGNAGPSLADEVVSVGRHERREPNLRGV
jgi:hypothetical protein